MYFCSIDVVCLFGLFRTAPVAYGGSQARGQIGAVAASLHHSHSNTGSLAGWARPGIKLASSWMLAGFVNHWTMMGIPDRNNYIVSKTQMSLLVRAHTVNSSRASDLDTVDVVNLFLQRCLRRKRQLHLHVCMNVQKIKKQNKKSRSFW